MVVAAVGSAQLYPPRCTIARWDEPGPSSGETAVYSDVRPCERFYGGYARSHVYEGTVCVRLYRLLIQLYQLDLIRVGSSRIITTVGEDRNARLSQHETAELR